MALTTHRFTAMHALLIVSVLIVVGIVWWGLSRPADPRAVSAPPVRRLSASERQAANEAVQVLKGLESVTAAGVSYRDYAPRVLDAKVAIDRYLNAHRGDDPEIAASLERSMASYVFASKVWNARIRAAADEYEGPNFVRSNHEEAASLCPVVVTVWDKAHQGDRNEGGIPTFSSEYYRAALDESVAALWRCSSESLAEATRRLTERSQ